VSAEAGAGSAGTRPRLLPLAAGAGAAIGAAACGRACPKSASAREPSSRSSRFAGLTSRCRTPAWASKLSGTEFAGSWTFSLGAQHATAHTRSAATCQVHIGGGKHSSVWQALDLNACLPRGTPRRRPAAAAPAVAQQAPAAVHRAPWRPAAAPPHRCSSTPSLGPARRPARLDAMRMSEGKGPPACAITSEAKHRLIGGMQPLTARCMTAGRMLSKAASMSGM